MFRIHRSLLVAVVLFQLLPGKSYAGSCDKFTEGEGFRSYLAFRPELDTNYDETLTFMKERADREGFTLNIEREVLFRSHTCFQISRRVEHAQWIEIRAAEVPCLRE